MGKGTYIDINTATIADVSAHAATLENEVTSLQGELRTAQVELSESLTSLENYVRMCFQKAVPIQRLDTQKDTVEKVVSLLGRASELAEEASRGLVNEAEALQLALDAMTGAASCASVISVVVSALNGETDCGDGWVSVGTWARTKAYTNGSKNWAPHWTTKNDYSNYNVIEGFDEKYVLYQKNYDHPGIACTATSDAIVGSILNGRVIAPDGTRWTRDSSGGWAYKWQYTDKLEGSMKMTVEEQCQTIYDYIQAGTPVVMRVRGHSVVAVGIRQGADRSALTPADILVVDPGQGAVKNANEIYSGWAKGTGQMEMAYGGEGYGLRIPK